MSILDEALEIQIRELENIVDETIGERVEVCMVCYSRRDMHDRKSCQFPEFVEVGVAIFKLRHMRVQYA